MSRQINALTTLLPLLTLMELNLRIYRKSHIPDGPGESSLGLESTRLSFEDIFSILQVKRNIYFNHGDTGFKVVSE